MSNPSRWQCVPARRGAAVRLAAGQTVQLVNTHGKQVVDTWAFNPSDLFEFLSMEHSRVAIARLMPTVGDVLVSNQRRPMLRVLADTTPGHHDMLMAACDRHRYEQLGAVGYHDNCADNLRSALAALELTTAVIPAPLNLFMNVPWQPDGGLAFVAPTSSAGEYVSLRAEMDLIVAFSACPQDMTPVNAGQSADVHFQVS
jgi:uncharacterized protein YcgI (DUF1989 family)